MVGYDDWGNMLDLLRRSQGYVIDAEIAPYWVSRLTQPVRGALFMAVITTRTAYAPGVAGAIVGWAVDRGYLAVDDEPAALTAVSEGIANAVVHGNLGLAGMDAYEADPEGYFSAIDQRMADDDYANSPIAVIWRRASGRLWLHVEDTGRGAMEIAPKEQAATPRLAGRGRKVMATMAVRVRYSLNGRRTSMSFPHA